MSRRMQANIIADVQALRPTRGWVSSDDDGPSHLHTCHPTAHSQRTGHVTRGRPATLLHHPPELLCRRAPSIKPRTTPRGVVTLAPPLATTKTRVGGGSRAALPRVAENVPLARVADMTAHQLPTNNKSNNKPEIQQQTSHPTTMSKDSSPADCLPSTAHPHPPESPCRPRAEPTPRTEEGGEL